LFSWYDASSNQLFEVCTKYKELKLEREEMPTDAQVKRKAMEAPFKKWADLNPGADCRTNNGRQALLDHMKKSMPGKDEMPSLRTQ
jgi:hypothetical protein